jgi:hypothetical protein
MISCFEIIFSLEFDFGRFLSAQIFPTEMPTLPGLHDKGVRQGSHQNIRI